MKNLTKEQINKLQKETKHLGNLNLAELNLIQFGDKTGSLQSNEYYIEVQGIIMELNGIGLPRFKGFVLRENNTNGCLRLLNIDHINTGYMYVDTQKLLNDQNSSRSEHIELVSNHHLLGTNGFLSDINYLDNKLLYVRFDNINVDNLDHHTLTTMFYQEKENEAAKLPYKDLDFIKRRIIPIKYINLYSLVNYFKRSTSEHSLAYIITKTDRTYLRSSSHILTSFRLNKSITADIITLVNSYIYVFISELTRLIDDCDPINIHNTVTIQNAYDKFKSAKEAEESKQVKPEIKTDGGLRWKSATKYDGYARYQTPIFFEAPTVTNPQGGGTQQNT